MGNKNAKKINRDYETEQKRIYDSGDRFDNYAYGNLPGAKQRGLDIHNKLFNSYDDILKGGMPGSGGGGRSGGSGGGYGEYEDFFKGFNHNIDPESIARMRGGGVFDEFAKTGGLNDAQRADFRARGTSAVPRFYEAIQNNLDQSKAVQGGYSPGYNSQMAKLARDRTQAGQEAIINTETDLTNMINEGRKWGSSSMSGAEFGVEDARARAAQMKMDAMGMGMNAKSRSDANSQWDADNDFRYNAMALGGLQDLYSSQPGEESMYLDNILANRGMTGQQSSDILNQRAGYNPNKGFWDRAGGLLQGAAGVGMQMFGAPGGGFQNPFKRKPKMTSPGMPRNNFSGGSTPWGGYSS